MIYFKLLKRIITHKFWVAYYCFQVGLYWQGITHDLSKFSRTEFLRSVKYWNDEISSLANEKRINGYSETFLHHRGRNPHHYEYWIDNHGINDTCVRMPYKYAVELICDWIGAGRAYQGKDFTYKKEYDYVHNKLSWAKMHQDTKCFVDFVFENLMMGEESVSSEDFILCEKTLKKIYREFNSKQ